MCYRFKYLFISWTTCWSFSRFARTCVCNDNIFSNICCLSSIVLIGWKYGCWCVLFDVKGVGGSDLKCLVCRVFVANLLYFQALFTEFEIFASLAQNWRERTVVYSHFGPIFSKIHEKRQISQFSWVKMSSNLVNLLNICWKQLVNQEFSIFTS